MRGHMEVWNILKDHIEMIKYIQDKDKDKDNERAHGGVEHLERPHRDDGGAEAGAIVQDDYDDGLQISRRTTHRVQGAFGIDAR